MQSGDLPYPDTGVLATHFLTVRGVARSRSFYADVLGGQVVLAENPCVVQLANSWIIMNPGGGPTPDKPDVTLVPPGDTSTVSSFLNLRVADIQTCYKDWSARGAEFLTPPIDRKAELRCYMRDPDGSSSRWARPPGCGTASSPTLPPAQETRACSRPGTRPLNRESYSEAKR